MQRWGEPRLTRDIDLSLLTGFGAEEAFVDELLSAYPARVPDAREFALKNRVVLLRTHTGIGIDIGLAAFPYEEEAMKRATPFEFLPDLILSTCSAEDLIIYKAFAARPLDWHDVESVLIRQQNRLDFAYIYRELEPLCTLKEAPEIVAQLKTLVEKVTREFP